MENNNESIHAHLKDLTASQGWRILLQHWNAEREKVIALGKSGRSEEAKMKRWAELDGFDRAVLLCERLLKITGAVKKRDSVPLGDKE